MTIPFDVLEFQVDNLTRQQLIRNHSAQRGLSDWWAPGVTAVASAAAGSFNGTAFLVAVGGKLGSEFHPVTPGWTLEVGYRAAIASGSPGVWIGQVQYYDAQFQPIAGGLVNITSSTSGADVAWTGTVPAGAVYVRAGWTLGGGTGGIRISRITLRQAATAGDLVAAPPESWLSIMGKSATIAAETGMALEGVEDVFEAGTLVATVIDASIDPAAVATLQRGRVVTLSALVSGTRYYVWEGRIETADADYDEKGRTVVILTATDVARPLLDATVSAVDVNTADKQINNVANRVGIGSFDGTTMPENTALGADQSRDQVSAAAWIKRICNTANKRAWVDVRNVLQQRDVAALGTAPVATFSDTYADAGALYYTGIRLNYGSRSCVNVLTINRINLDEVFDNGNKAYGPYIASASEHEAGRIEAGMEILSGSPSAYAAAVLPVFAKPTVFPTEIRLDALRDLAKTLALATYQPVRVKRTASGYNQVVRVLRIKHEITSRKWNVTIKCRPLETAAAGVVITNPGAGADTGPAENVILNTKPLASRERTAVQTLTTGTEAKISFDGAIQNDGIPYDTVNREFTIPRTGRYDVTANVEFVAGATGFRRMYVRRNGALISGGRKTVTPSAADNVTAQVTGTWRFTAGQKISVGAIQNSGANRNIGVDETNVQIKFAD